MTYIFFFIFAITIIVEISYITKNKYYFVIPVFISIKLIQILSYAYIYTNINSDSPRKIIIFMLEIILLIFAERAEISLLKNSQEKYSMLNFWVCAGSMAIIKILL